jgi:ABC-2 type transport system permease protein
MYNDLRFAMYAIKKNIQGSAELRTSFLLNIFGMMVNNTAFIILWIFFIKSVGVIGGWTALDIVCLQGFTALSYGIIFSFGMGIRKLPDYVSSGAFDRFMLSPKNLLVRVATSAFNASAIGDMAFGIICFVIYGFLVHITLGQFLLLILLALISTAIFLSVVIIIFSSSFFFVDASSASSSLFELFFTPALFHGGAFQGIIRFVFVFLIPSLLIGSLPVEAVREISFSKLALLMVLAVIWAIISMKFFNYAIKKYESSNFMTFGS